MEESPTMHTFGSLVINAIFSRRAQDLASLTRNVMKGSYLVIPPQTKHIEYRIWEVVNWKKFMILNLMKPMGHKNKKKILMM